MSDNIYPAQPSDDAEILSLFRKWMAAERAADALKGRNEEDEEEEEAFQAASDRTCELIHAIAELPATGVTDFAIKVYLCQRVAHGGTFKDPCAIRSLGADADQRIDTHIEQSIIEDAVRLLPEAVAKLIPVYFAADAGADTVLPEVIGFGEPEER